MMSADDSGYGCLNKKRFSGRRKVDSDFAATTLSFFVQHQLSLIDTRDKIVL